MNGQRGFKVKERDMENWKAWLIFKLYRSLSKEMRTYVFMILAKERDK